MIEVKTALISVYKKDGVLELARVLKEHGIEILSTGGTAKLLSDGGIDVVEVEDYTEFPEMLSGRVKTLHPKIHAGILARRDNKKDMEILKEHGIKPIDMVVVNLYPFEEVIKKDRVELDEAIEFIDIGGPTMIRAAAKNYKHVVVLSQPEQYQEIIDELKKNRSVSDDLSYKLAREAFYLTSCYDSKIANYLEGSELPREILIPLRKVADLRYGENSHQRGALYEDTTIDEPCLIDAEQLAGKKLSFNNWLDLDAAVICLAGFENPAAVIIKHNNPCGIAVARDLKQAFLKAHESDPLSAFGSIIGLNRRVDGQTAEAMVNSGFIECVIALDYTSDAVSVLKSKKNLRIIKLEKLEASGEFDFRKIQGGFLVQETDKIRVKEDSLKVVTKKSPSPEAIEALLFAWGVVKNVRSNAIVIAKSFKDDCYATVGIGAGQMSRVDSVIIACRKAGERTKGAVLASDAFFPMPDSIEIAVEHGITAIIQPGGSIKDEEVIKKADELGVAMVFTGIRHFRH